MLPRIAGERRGMLMEEQIEQVLDRAAVIVAADRNRRVDHTRVGLERSRDVRPLLGHDIRDLSADVEEVRLDPHLPPMKSGESPKPTRVPRPAQNGRVRAESIGTDHQHGDAPSHAREPDERGALVGSGHRVLGGDPAGVGRGVVLLLQVHAELEAVLVMCGAVIALVIDTAEQRPHGLTVAHRDPLPPLGHAVDQLVRRAHCRLLVVCL